MTWIATVQLLTFLAALLAITKPLGAYMASVYDAKWHLLSWIFGPVERLIYRVTRVSPLTEQSWTTYAGACLSFGVVNFLLFYVLLRLQHVLPVNQLGPGASITSDLAFNTSISFMTNTSWQSYAGESTLSYLAQMLGVTVQSFTSAAAGMAVAVALIRGFVRQSSKTVGNFWVDVTRSTLYILLPLSFIGALFLISQGVIQNFHSYPEVSTIEQSKQKIALGPVASQEPIKLLSGDGGGFFNANSAHPFENPTPLSNFVEMLLILAIPAALTYTFGRMIHDQGQGWALFIAMATFFIGGSCVAIWSEQSGNPALYQFGIPGPNMEGKEVRFGAPTSALFSIVSTASADGAMNSAHDSFMPLSGLVQMLNLKSGEVVFGGTGTGLVSMILIALIAVFIAGLMVGRTPEYLGKKIEAREMKMVMISFVATAAAIVIFSGASFLVRFSASGYWNPPGLPTANLTNSGPHGLSEILYDNASAVATNGSSFAGLNANTPWFNLTLGIEMLIGRFLVIIPALAVAGSLARKRSVLATTGTMPTKGPLFVGLLMGTIVLITSLTFFPSLTLGPIVEQFLMNAGALFH